DASGVTALGRQLKKTFPAEDFIIKDKYAQNETVYKMMRYEKIIIFGILLFIILVVACNVYGSLTMLIIEKRGDIATLRSMGASEALVGSIFTLEGMMITLLGLVSGMLLGLLLCLLQQKFGIIGMPGDFLVQSYPVVVRSFDLIISFAGVLLIGVFITFFPTKSTLKKML
ncbi:MAG: FtsX-like permease family protein, partial [Bacteroidales bacterium]|nr:FtsX-like permease family protein [Bacteroidales bacterium]